MNKIINKKVELIDSGLIEYDRALELQKDLFGTAVDIKLQNRRSENEDPLVTPNHLILCEHPHVYTLGKTGSEENLLINSQELAEKGASFHHIGRGGDITYHGPGQLVGYPILDLENFFTDIHKYLRLLEEAIIQTVAEYNIDTGRIEGLTGVWVNHQNPVQGRKICAFGVRASRWVTMHGFALNVDPDLSYFNNIVPCGIPDKAVTSIANEFRLMNKEEAVPALKEVGEKVLRHMESLFEMEIVKGKTHEI